MGRDRAERSLRGGRDLRLRLQSVWKGLAGGCWVDEKTSQGAHSPAEAPESPAAAVSAMGMRAHPPSASSGGCADTTRGGRTLTGRAEDTPLFPPHI